MSETPERKTLISARAILAIVVIVALALVLVFVLWSSVFTPPTPTATDGGTIGTPFSNFINSL